MKRIESIPTFLLLVFGLLVSFSAPSVYAQNIRNNDYSPDKALKSNARVNPSTLAMELTIPLGGYAGRAGNGMPIALDYSSKVWEMKNIGLWQSFMGNTLTGVTPLYAKRSAGGWTSSLGTPRIDYKYDPYQGNNQEVTYEGQTYSAAPWESSVDNDLFNIKRLQVQMPDGSTHEFRASDTPIDCGSINSGCTADMTGTFLSVDGSRMRLESGSSSSVLYMPDGSRYIFGTPDNGTLGTPAHTFIDRHGNKMTFDMGNREWIDTMGRVIKDPIAFNWNGTQNQTVENDVARHFPGFGASDYDVKFGWHYLLDANGDDALENTSDTLRNLSDIYCNGNAEFATTGVNLFTNVEAPVRVCGSGTTSQGPAFNPIVLTKITLPNDQRYEFKYNVYGEITKVIYPSGGYERFAYAAVAPVQVGSPAYDQANRGVTDRWVSATGNSGDEVHWTYSATRGTVSSPAPYKVRVTAPDTSYTEQYIEDEPDSNGAWRPYGFGNAKTGRSYEDRVYDSSTSHYLLARKLTNYETTGPLTGGYAGATRDMRPSKEIAITFDPNNSYALATMSETVYDTTGNSDPAYFSSLNAKQTKKYDYVVVSASTAASANITAAAGWFSSATPAVVTEIDYLYDSNYKARNITGLVTETRVKDASGNVKAKSQITYDESGYSLSSTGTLPTAASGTWTDPLTELGSTIGSKRGLPTSVKSYYDISNSLYIETHSFYDQFGNLRKSRDGRGNDTETLYDDDYAFAYPTSVITSVPDSTGTYGSNAAFTTSVIYDPVTGLPTSSTDANSQTTTFEYVDPLLRPTKVTAPTGAQTITEYGNGTSASTRWVKVKSQIDDTNWKQGYKWFDGLGRSIRSQSVDASGDVFVMTCYDNMGRAAKATNPFRGFTTQDCSTTTGLEWTTNTFDTAGRPWKVTTPDSAVVETNYSLATTGDQIGSVVTVADQAGKLRRSITNALGQLTRVDEPGDSGLGAINSPYQPTLYTYDLLSNLSTVVQASATTAQCGGASSCSQTRTFTYDSLSRLKTAANPESGTILYTYDNNNNLATKTDARSITTTYSYDDLNRVKTRTYSDNTTPNVAYYYDLLDNAKGKLIKVSSAVSTTEYTSFDILGRVTGHKQTTDGGATEGYSTAYAYNLSGALIEETYPSTRKVKNILDPNGNLAKVESKKTSSLPNYLNYALNFTYNPAGAVTSMELGNGRWESTQFNSRLQPTQIALGNTIGAADKLKLDYTYGVVESGTLNTAKNNGNVQSQTITVPTVGSNTGFVAVQTYGYDELNRLKDATENVTPTGGSSSQSWKQEFSFDRYGNRSFVTGTGHTDTLGTCTTMCNPTFDTSNNRINSTGFSFDYAGNTTRDAGDRKFTYDAENKQTKVESLSTGTNTVTGTLGEYTYDGDGKRVKKYVPATGEITVFVYDAAGKQIAEYSTVVANSTDAKVSYLTNDHLGSPRINTDRDGNVTARHDYHPFGEEIVTAARTANTEYASDTIRKQFTGYERDTETDLDFAQARYGSYALGRFTSPDPLEASASVGNPQTWNRYIFVLNNPLLFADPTGMSPTDFIDENGTRSRIDDGKDQVLTATSEQVARLNEVGANSAAYSTMLGALETSGASLGLTRDQFTERVATVYGESSAWRSPAGDELANEMKSFAYANQRNPTAATYGSNSDQADIYRQTPHDNETDKMKLGNLAVVNQVRGGPDPSGGATNWDGRDQAMIPASETRSHGIPAGPYGGKKGTTWEAHKNSIGWKISNADYAKWRASVGPGFRAPQESNSQRAGSYVSTAVWAGTIFWRKKP